MNQGDFRTRGMLLFLATVFATGVQAQVVRTFVASTGFDTNPCTRTAPCRNFNAAITAVDSDGEIVALDSAGYGPLTIAKPVTIVAPRGIHAAIAPSAGTAVTVAVGASERVALRGLYLNSQGAAAGIVFQSGSVLTLDGIVVNGFTDNGVAASATGDLLIRDGFFRNNGLSGLYLGGFFGTTRAAIDRSRFERNGLAGLEINGNARVSVVDSVAAANFRGFQGAGQDAEMNLERCLSANNVVGLFTSGGATVIMRVSNSTVTNNTLFGIEPQDGQILSRLNNTVEGNAAGEAFSGTFSAK